MITQSPFSLLLKRLFLIIAVLARPLFRLGVVVTAILIFLYLASAVRASSSVVSIDMAVSGAVHANTTPALVRIMQVITLAGNEAATALTFVLIVLFILKRRWRALILIALAMGGAQFLIDPIKAIFQRARPDFTDALSYSSGYSFPSGHSVAAIALYGMLIYLLLGRGRSALGRAVIIVALGTLILLIGFSRVYLGVHYPSDVLAGFAAGLIWLYVLIGASEFVAWWRSGRFLPHLA